MQASRTPCRATRFLDVRPGLRARVESDSEYQSWRAGFPTVEIDGVHYLVMGGDMLREEDEAILEWARRKAMVGGDEIEAVLADVDDTERGRNGT